MVTRSQIVIVVSNRLFDHPEDRLSSFSVDRVCYETVR